MKLWKLRMLDAVGSVNDADGVFSPYNCLLKDLAQGQSSSM